MLITLIKYYTKYYVKKEKILLSKENEGGLDGK